MNIAHQVLKVSSWILTPFQMPRPKFGRRLFPTSVLRLLLWPPEVVVSQLADPVGEASAEFVRELELTIRKHEDPAANAPLVEVRESLPKGQDPSPSIAAFNKSFGTSHRGELLSVGREVTKNRDGTPPDFNALGITCTY
jgi:hypothetical protein